MGNNSKRIGRQERKVLNLVTLSEHRTETSVTRNISFNDKEISYDFAGDVLPGPIRDLDAALVATIFMAMRTGEPTHVAGGVSISLLENIEEFQRAWALLRPDLFRMATITAEEELADRPRPNTAVIAYSGGVDANSSLAFHMEGHAGRRKRKMEAAVLIHGMDVPLSKDFDPVSSLARSTLSHYGLPLTVIKTNWHEFNSHWEMVFVSGITGCLHQFDVGYGIISSDEDYGSLVMPWSSNPATNHLLSGLRIMQTEGTGFTRTQKVKMLPPALTTNLRVCWQDISYGNKLNCGRCEKCIRTKMNFEANGLPSPACLGPRLTALDGLRPLARNTVQRNYLVDALRMAQANNIDKGWVRTLPVGLFLSKPPGPFLTGIIRSPLRLIRRTIKAIAFPGK